MSDRAKARSVIKRSPTVFPTGFRVGAVSAIDTHIARRLRSLDEEIVGTEIEGKYQETKAVLLDIFKELRCGKTPYIGVDDDGQISAEWHGGEDYKIITITPFSVGKIIMTCVKSLECVVQVRTSLDTIIRNSGDEPRFGGRYDVFG